MAGLGHLLSGMLDEGAGQLDADAFQAALADHAISQRFDITRDEFRGTVRCLARYKIEGLFAQDEFVSDFDSEGDLRGHHIPVIADKRGKANKHDRIESTEAYFHRRWVWFNIEEKESADQQELLDQYYNFEKGSQAHDDGPDCAHGGFTEVNLLAFQEAFEPRIAQHENHGRNDY